jgi:hypothetical protein
MRKGAADALARLDVLIGLPSGVLISPTEDSSDRSERMRAMLDGFAASPGFTCFAGSR